MSTLARFGSSTRLHNLFSLDTSHASKASTVGSTTPHQARSASENREHRSKCAEASPQAARSAPGERSKYQLWPALEQGVAKPPLGAPEPVAVPNLDRNRSVRIHQSAEHMWLVYGQGDSRRPTQSKHYSKRTQSSPKNTHQPLLDVADITSTTRTNRRSCSAPGRTSQKETLRPHEDVSTEYSERTTPPEQDLNENGVTTGEGRRSLKRASSVLLPAELAELIFPTFQRRAFDADGRKIEAFCEQSRVNIKGEESENEIPPAVPPKTPPKKSAPTLHVSPLKPRPTKGPAWDKELPQISVAGTPQLPPDESANNRGESKHFRDGSGDSVMDRGRPMKRSRSQTRKGIMGSVDGSAIDLTCDMLPKGYHPHNVSSNLSREETRKLERQARSQAGRFEVLHLKDVKALSQQVRLLDEQCEYLRGFAKSLRRNRRTLHAQTISYLKSPALSEIPRQSILQKVETLADLDDTIDEWAKKLERADDQRLRARQRLLEHIAAVMAVPPAIDTKGVASDGSGVGREHTPPQSPEPLKSPPMTAGYDVESIRIYAGSEIGSEMHALLGVLDKETSALASAKNMF